MVALGMASGIKILAPVTAKIIWNLAFLIRMDCGEHLTLVNMDSTDVKPMVMI
jgi:hypothetical protein